MADYGCHALWWDGEPDRIGNLDPATLGLSPGLVAALAGWAGRFDAILNAEDPAASCFPSPEAEAAFIAEGQALARRVAAELGPRAQLRFQR